MTNLEKIDCAVTTTLEAHPDYHEIMVEILMKKLLEEDPLVTAKFFSRANDAISEIVKNAVKVSYLLKEKGIETSSSEQYLDGSQDDILFGSTACHWLTEELEKQKDTNIDDIMESHPEILGILVSVFKEVRYSNNFIITVKELDNLRFITKLSSIFEKIDNDIHSFQ